MLALLTHQFPELMVIFAKAVSIVAVMGLALLTHRLFENFELQYWMEVVFSDQFYHFITCLRMELGLGDGSQAFSSSPF